LEIKEMADGKKVGFFNNYAAISNYIFYTGDSAVHLSTPDYRFNQYDLWDEEIYARGQSLIAVQSKHLNPPNLTRMATGEMKGFINIAEFQPLNKLELKIGEINKSGNNLNIEFMLTNYDNFSVFTDHISEPAICLAQDKSEIYSVSLKSLLQKNEIRHDESVKVNLTIPENNVDIEKPLTVYTRSRENIRGEMVSVKLRAHF
jgi:hypothetical protein